MEAIVRHVRELNSTERSTIEQMLGQALGENQEVLIRVVEPELGGQLPDWCRVYEGLSDEQVVDLEQTILSRAELSRSA